MNSTPYYNIIYNITDNYMVQGNVPDATVLSYISRTVSFIEDTQQTLKSAQNKERNLICFFAMV